MTRLSPTRFRPTCRVHAGQAIVTASYAVISDRITCDSDGLLLLAVTSMAEQSQARQLVQQLVLQKWPAIVVVLDGLGSASRLANMEPHTYRVVAPTLARRG